MRKYLPFIISFFFLLVSILFWDKITLPYDESNSIIGQYSLKKINPLNDLLRFLIFIIPATLFYLVTFLYFNKSTFNLNKNSSEYFLNHSFKKNGKQNLDNYFYLFIALIIIEFLSFNFRSALIVDTFHDSVFLTPPTNYLANEGFFSSTLYDYGFTGNNLGLFFNYFFGFYTLGSINFIKLLLILFIKLLLILISKKLIEYIDYENFYKKIFFILFTFIIISLPNYYDLSSHFSPRSALYLLVILLISSSLCAKKNNDLKFFIIGTFSLISLLWWFDIGFYVNFLVILLSLYLINHSEKRNLLFLASGVIISWAGFLIFSPSNEIIDFFYNLKFILFTTDYLIGIEYLKPFSENSFRWTKALLIIFISCICLVNLNLSKKINLNVNLKIYLNLIFISGIIYFKSALTRSDVYHLKYSSGLYTLIFIFVIIYFLFFYLNKNKFVGNYLKKLNNKIQKQIIFLFFSILSFLFLGGYLNVKNQNPAQENIINLINFNSNIKELIVKKTESQLKERDLLVLQKYRKLSANDQCIQYFSDDNFFPYFLNKPTCTKFYLSNQILTNFSEDEFISQFKKSMPNVILFESPKKLLFNYDNLQNANKFVRDNYEFYENFNGFIFYKKIKQ